MQGEGGGGAGGGGAGGGWVRSETKGGGGVRYCRVVPGVRWERRERQMEVETFQIQQFFSQILSILASTFLTDFKSNDFLFSNPINPCFNFLDR